MMIPESLYQIAGIVGVGLYLASYALLQSGVLKGVGYSYTLMNLAASALVLVSLALHFNLWAAIIQISWIAISIGGMIRLHHRSQPVDFTAEETKLVRKHFSTLTPYDARQLLNAGSWHSSYHGTTLTKQGNRIDALFYIADGSAHVFVNGARIGAATTGNLIGEVTCLSRAPATATTVVHGSARMFRLPVARLRAPMRQALVPVVLAEMQSKLRRTNELAAVHREAACKG